MIELPRIRGGTPVWCGIALFLWGVHAQALTLTDTNAGIIDTSHLQIATFGGGQPHLLRVVTPTDRLHAAIDADVLLADGLPLVMTWRRDAGDADVIELAAALVVDSAPSEVEMRLRGGASPPAFAALGDVSTNAVVVLAAPQLARLQFAEPIEPLADVLVGAVDATISRSPLSWTIDIGALPIGGTFEWVLRAGPPGDANDDDDVDLADYAILHACLDGLASGIDCDAYFDFDADSDVDLLDFALFQATFTVDSIEPWEVEP